MKVYGVVLVICVALGWTMMGRCHAGENEELVASRRASTVEESGKYSVSDLHEDFQGSSMGSRQSNNGVGQGDYRSGYGGHTMGGDVGGPPEAHVASGDEMDYGGGGPYEGGGHQGGMVEKRVPGGFSAHPRGQASDSSRIAMASTGSHRASGEGSGSSSTGVNTKVGVGFEGTPLPSTRAKGSGKHDRGKEATRRDRAGISATVTVSSCDTMDSTPGRDKAFDIKKSQMDRFRQWEAFRAKRDYKEYLERLEVRKAKAAGLTSRSISKKLNSKQKVKKRVDPAFIGLIVLLALVVVITIVGTAIWARGQVAKVNTTKPAPTLSPPSATDQELSAMRGTPDTLPLVVQRGNQWVPFGIDSSNKTAVRENLRAMRLGAQAKAAGIWDVRLANVNGVSIPMIYTDEHTKTGARAGAAHRLLVDLETRASLFQAEPKDILVIKLANTPVVHHFDTLFPEYVNTPVSKQLAAYNIIADAYLVSGYDVGYNPFRNHMVIVPPHMRRRNPPIAPVIPTA